MTVIRCCVNHESAGDRIEVRVGPSADILKMAGVLWVSQADSAEVVRRLQDPDTEAEDGIPPAGGGGNVTLLPPSCNR